MLMDWKAFLKYIWKDKGHRIINTISKNKSGRNHSSQCQDLQYICSNQDTIVLVEEYTHRSAKQNREFKNISTQICPINF